MARGNQRRHAVLVQPLVYLQFTPPAVLVRREAIDLAAEGGRRSQLGGAGPQHVLVVRRGDGGADEWTHPEDPVVIPGLVVVVDDSSAQAPGRVDAGAGDGDRGQMDHEHRKPDGERGKHGDMRVTGVALGVGGGEDGVDEHEGADDLRGEAGALGVAGAELVGAAAVAHVEGALEALDEPDAADGAEALRHDVEQRAHQRDLARQEEAEGDGRVDVPTRHPRGAVDEDEDHAAEGPGDAEHADAAARRVGARRRRVRLVLVPDHRGHRDVEEEQRGHELGDHRAVQRPLGQLLRVHQRRRGRVRVVLALVRRRGLDVLGHSRASR
uniref:Uncharacterized protein n=1 Tax=Zea mays TaxID=4577 RepID=C0HGR1_MAIZE|nr:unknown [Zea mays]